jgi:hypothetical protein
VALRPSSCEHSICQFGWVVRREPETVNEREVERTQRELHRGRADPDAFFAKRGNRVTGAAIVALVFVVGSCATGTPRPTPTSRAVPGPGVGYPLSRSAIPEALSSTLQQAQDAYGGSLPIPDSPDASTADIKGVWLDAKSSQVDIYYSTGLRLLVEPNASESQTTIQSEDQLAVMQNGGASQLMTIDGVPAVATARDFAGNGQCGMPDVDCIPSQQNPSDVTMILNGVSVEVTADWPLDRLVAVANTIP